VTELVQHDGLQDMVKILAESSTPGVQKYLLRALEHASLHFDAACKFKQIQETAMATLLPLRQSAAEDISLSAEHMVSFLQVYDVD